MSDQFDRSPELKPGDLTRGLHWLETEAERGSPSARAVLAEIARLRRWLEHIAVHGDHDQECRRPPQDCASDALTRARPNA